MAQKMKLPFVVLLLFGLPRLKGQQKIEEFDQILLRFSFPSSYNSNGKACCKLYPGGCFPLLDSSGYTSDFLKGRVTKTEQDGWIEFKITKVQFQDGGFYRCIVLGTSNMVYKDYYVEITEATNYSPSQAPLLSTSKGFRSSTGHSADSTGPVMTQDQRSPWTLGLPLMVIVPIIVTSLVTVVVGVVCFIMKARTKPKQPDKHGETLCESLKQEAPDTSGVVYTTVDFSAHQSRKQIYANVSKSRAAETVEYSTLAIHR